MNPKRESVASIYTLVNPTSSLSVPSTSAVAIMGGVSSWLWQSNARTDLAAPLPDGVAGLNDQTGKLFCNTITKGKFHLSWRCDGALWSDPADGARAAGTQPRPLRQCDACAAKQGEYERAAAAASAATATASAASASPSAADPVAPAAASDSHAR